MCCFNGCFGALIYAFLTVTLRANQTVTGLSLTIFGTGFTKFMGNSIADIIKKSTGVDYVTIPQKVSSFLHP